jgi:hypothetical protein
MVACVVVVLNTSLLIAADDVVSSSLFFFGCLEVKRLCLCPTRKCPLGGPYVVRLRWYRYVGRTCTPEISEAHKRFKMPQEIQRRVSFPHVSNGRTRYDSFYLSYQREEASLITLEWRLQSRYTGVQWRSV